MQLRRGYEVDVSAVFTDNMGNVTTVDDVPVWVVADPSLFTLSVAPDGLSAVLHGTGDAVGGTTTLTLTVTGIEPSEESLELVAGTAATAAFAFGEPRPIVIV